MRRVGLSVLAAWWVAGQALALGPGDRVVAHWRESGLEFSGKVGSIQGNLVKVDFDDGTSEEVDVAKVRAFDWAVGGKISCRWKGEKAWYAGTITALEDPKLHVRYDDGDEEDTTLALCRRRIESGQVPAGAPASPGAPAAPVAPAATVPGQLGPGQFRVIWRDKAPKWTGTVFDASGSPPKWKGENLGRGSRHLVTWPEAAGDDFGNKPVKYLLFFGRELLSPYWIPENVQKWFDHQAPEQLDWYIECAPDVRQLLDMNPSPNLTLFIAVELSNGKRYPFSGGFFDTRYPMASRWEPAMSSKLAPNVIRVPEDYNWPK